MYFPNIFLKSKKKKYLVPCCFGDVGSGLRLFSSWHLVFIYVDVFTWHDLHSTVSKIISSGKKQDLILEDSPHKNYYKKSCRFDSKLHRL